MTGNHLLFDRLNGQLTQFRAIGFSHMDMGNFWPFIERRDPPLGQINKIIADHKIAGFNIFLERTCGTGADYSGNPQLFERMQIGAVVYFMRRELMFFAVSGQERHFFATNFGQSYFVGRFAVGSIYFDFLHIT